MEIFSQMNWLAVVVATLAYFMLGAIWYSKVLFGTKWATLVKLDTNDPNLKKGMGQMMAATFVIMLIVSIGLEFLIIKFNFVEDVMYGVKLGLLTGICFSAAAVSINYVYERKPTSLYLINNGYHVIGQMLVAAILVVWR
jgi:hypothetical protein